MVLTQRAGEASVMGQLGGLAGVKMVVYMWFNVTSYGHALSQGNAFLVFFDFLTFVIGICYANGIFYLRSIPRWSSLES